ncbi:hypothetical protein [Desulfofalx alkaliphila]|uniref:hypothetical protein n=1 Tax=Desulfofalx alkaliphila TaxID=105483 RepID=UPI0004E25AA1|nr:hypothetical protein [Desulfofalx alkaliphila]
MNFKKSFSVILMAVMLVLTFTGVAFAKDDVGDIELIKYGDETKMTNTTLRLINSFLKYCVQAKAEPEIESRVNKNYIINEPANEIPVLMYHHLLKEEENPYINNGAVLNVENFEQQMKILHDNNYNTITLNEPPWIRP